MKVKVDVPEGDSEACIEESDSDEEDDVQMPVQLYASPKDVSEMQRFAERLQEAMPNWPPASTQSFLDGIQKAPPNMQAETIRTCLDAMGASDQATELLQLLRAGQAKMQGEEVLCLSREYDTYFHRKYRPSCSVLDSEDAIISRKESRGTHKNVSVHVELLPVEHDDGATPLRRTISLPREVGWPESVELWPSHGRLHLLVADSFHSMLHIWEVHSDVPARCRVEGLACLKLHALQLQLVEDELLVLLAKEEKSKMLLRAYDLPALLAAGGTPSKPSAPPPALRSLVRGGKSRAKPGESVHEPQGFCAWQGVVYVADTDHDRIARYALASGEYLGAWGADRGAPNPITAYELQKPRSCAVLGNRLYVAEVRKVKAFDLHDGKPVGEYAFPSAVCHSVVAGRDRLLVVSMSIRGGRHRICCLRPKTAEALESALQAARAAPCLLCVDTVGLQASVSAEVSAIDQAAATTSASPRQSEVREEAHERRRSSIGLARGLLREATECQRLAKEGLACDFFFLNASKLREPAAAEMTSLPRFQALYAMEGWLERRRCTFAGACFGEYADEYLAVSHRWETPSDPDPTGAQFRALREHVLGHPRLQWIFLDWCSLPQGERSREQRLLFRMSLPNINMIYLGCSVLLLLDRTYLSRFWVRYQRARPPRPCSTS